MIQILLVRHCFTQQLKFEILLKVNFGRNSKYWEKIVIFIEGHTELNSWGNVFRTNSAFSSLFIYQTNGKELVTTSDSLANKKV